MAKIDKYIIRAFAGSFIFSFLAFVAVWLGTGPMYYIAKLLARYDSPFIMAVKLMLYTIPVAAYASFPVASLLGVVIAFGQLSASSEITAMRASGMSFYRIVRPIISVGLLVSVMTFLVGQYLMPLGNLNFNTITNYQLKKSIVPKRHESNLLINTNAADGIGGDGNMVLFARDYSPLTKSLTTVTVQSFDKEGVLQWAAVANKAQIKDGNLWMQDGRGFDFTGASDNSSVRTLSFEKQSMTLAKEQEHRYIIDYSSDELTITGLRQKIAYLQAINKPSTEFQTELYGRTGLSFACVIVTLIGAPLALRSARQGASAGVGLAVGVIFVYFAVFQDLANMSKSGIINPMLAAFLPDIVGFLLGMFLLHRADRIK